ncbi:MAG: DUF6531 domain-containing protein [Candidatus Coatesbacteria bacterium]
MTGVRRFGPTAALAVLLPLLHGCAGAPTQASYPGSDQPIIPGSMCLTLLVRDGLGIPTVTSNHQPIAVRIALPRRQERLAQIDLLRLSLPSGVFLDQPRLAPYPVSSGALMPLNTPREQSQLFAGNASDPRTQVFMTQLSALLSRTYANAMGASSLLGQGLTVSPVINTFTGNLFICSLDAAALWRGLNVMCYRIYNGLQRAPGPFGPGWTHSFAARLDFNEDMSVQYTRWDGSRFCYKPEGPDHWKSPDGFDDALTRSGTGYLITDVTGFFLRFDGSGLLQEIGNPLPFRLRLKYDGGRLIEVRNIRTESGLVPGMKLQAGSESPETSVEGPAIFFTYDVEGRITQIRSTAGTQMLYEYNEGGRLARVTSNTQQSVEYRYDGDGRVAEIRRRDSVGLKSDPVYGIMYDAKDRVAEIVDPSGQPVMRLNYRWALDRTTEIVLGQLRTVVTDKYDERGVVIERTETKRTDDPNQTGTPQSTNQRRATDDALNVLRLDNSDGTNTRWTYDAKGHLVRAQDSTGDWVEISYNAEFDQPEYLRESHGRWIRFIYVSDQDQPTNRRGRIDEVVLDNGQRYKLSYDNGGVPRDLITATGDTQPLDLGLPAEVPKGLWDF